MKILICTQMVDITDSDLGFFVEWIREFAKQAEHVEVICLKEGVHSLPENVRVHSLGKEKGSASWLTYSWRFLSLIVKLRRNYDTVFVHMNPEYVVLGSFWWHRCGKKVSLWYTHKSVDTKLRIAVACADVIFTASKESFRLPTKKLRVVGHGIDTNFFSPDSHVVRGDWLLSAGRLMRSKRHDLAIERAAQEGKALRIVGEGPERAALEVFAKKHNVDVQFFGALSQQQLRDEYRRAEYFIHTSETGSLDKVVLEALACGLSIRTNDPALKFLEHETPAYVRTHHSLPHLISAIMGQLS